MSWTCDEVLAALGDEAQVTAGGIVVLAMIEGEDGITRPKHIKIGNFSGMSFILTEDGIEYLADYEKPEAVAKPKKVIKKKAVEPVEDELILE